MIPKQFFNNDNSGTLRLLTEEEWRGIGITQSLGWEHYEVHGTSIIHVYDRSKRMSYNIVTNAGLSPILGRVGNGC